jgi:hypothetical protein
MSQYDQATSAFDAARFAYSSALRANGSDYITTNLANIDKVKKDVLAAKNNAFEQVSTDMARTNDMTSNLKLYQTRTADATRLANELATNNARIKAQIRQDKEVTQRQFEINEWYTYKKQETAGTLMGVAIALGLILLSLIASKLGFLAPGAFQVVSFVLVAFIGIWVYWRISYNGVDRDPMLWHRRRFTPPKEAPATPKCDSNGNLVLPTIDLKVPCADKLEQKLQDLLNSTTNEITQFQEGAPSKAALCSLSSTTG